MIGVETFAVMSLVDLATTWWALRRGGTELSPGGSVLLAAYGFEALVLVKTAAITMIAGLTSWRQHMGAVVATAALLMTTAAVGWNVYWAVR